MQYKIFFAAICVMLGLFRPASAGESEMTTSISFPKAEEYGTVHVEATIHASPEVVWEILTDMNQWRSWMPMVKASYFYSAPAVAAIPANVSKDQALFDRIHQEHPGSESAPPAKGVTRRTTFESYNLPWPIKDEWVVRHYTYDATLARDHRYRASWRKVWGDLPEDGHWFITPHPINADAAYFIYHFRVKAKRGVALALFSAGIKHSVKKFIKAIRAEAAKR